MTICVALLTLPVELRAQPRGRPYRIGFIGNAPLTNPDSMPLNRIFVQALRDRGYDEGTNLVIERRFVEGRVDRYPEFAAEMVRLNVDVIVVGSGPGAQAAKAATAKIPIVMNGVSDPVAAGVIYSLAHPGGNVTGIADLQVDLIPKRLELLKAAAPRIVRVVFLHGQFAGYSPTRAAAVAQERAMVAQGLGLTLLDVEMKSPHDFETAAGSMIRERPDALLLSPNPTNYILRKELAEFALKHRFPTIGGTREMAAAGALMSYGLDYGDQLRQVAAYIDKILKGVNPADLPVEQPTKFDLVINLKTAKLLGLSFSPSLLQRADDKIE